MPLWPEGGTKLLTGDARSAINKLEAESAFRRKAFEVKVEEPERLRWKGPDWIFSADLGVSPYDMIATETGGTSSELSLQKMREAMNDLVRQRKEVSKLKVGDWVRVLNGRNIEPNCSSAAYWDKSYDAFVGKRFVLREPNDCLGGGPCWLMKGVSQRWVLNENWLELVGAPASKIDKMKSLIKRLLNPDDALLAEEVLDDDGDLEFSDPRVQEALMQTDGFRENLLKILKAEREEKEAKKK